MSGGEFNVYVCCFFFISEMHRLWAPHSYQGQPAPSFYRKTFRCEFVVLAWTLDHGNSQSDTAKICCPKTDILLPPQMESAFEEVLVKIQWIHCCNSSINAPSKIHLINLFSAYCRTNSWNWNFELLLLLRGTKYLIGQCWICLAFYQTYLISEKIVSNI